MSLRCAWIFVLACVLAGCPGPTTTDAGPDVSDSGSRDAVDGGDVAPVDVPSVDVPTIPRCGPGAVPYPDDAGRCAVAMPMPDAAVVPGVCTPTVNAPTAALRTNEMDGSAVVIPSGRRVERAATRLALSGVPFAMLRIPGTSLEIVSDGGLHTEHLRAIDVSHAPPTIVAGGELSFPRDATMREPALWYGLAYDAASRTLYASGGGGNRIYVVHVSATGALTLDAARTIDLGITEGRAGHTGTMLSSAYVSGLALSDDGTQLFAVLQRGWALAIYNTAAPTMPRMVFFDPVTPASQPMPFDVVTRPHDSNHVYVSLWGEGQIAEVDVAMASVSRTFNVGKNPEDLLFDASGARLYVAAADDDSIDVIDLSMPSAPVTTTHLGATASALRGLEPSQLAWGPTGRLYVTLAEENAIDVLDGTSLARIGRIPTEWYPTDVDVGSDGTVVVITGKGIGSGPNNRPGVDQIDDLLQGSIAVYAPPSDADLTTGTMTVAHDNTIANTFNDVTCPSGAPYDFPVPRVGSTQPSTRIHHVIMVVRENKTYDALLGDLAGTTANPANGDATLTLAPAAMMDSIAPNFRSLIRTFTNADNYYSNAEQSLQGHMRTTEGRTTDYVERTWLTTWGRGTRNPPDQGIVTIAQAEEGSLFAAMDRAMVHTENWGEIVNDTPSQGVGARYPGLFFNMNVTDITKALAFGDWVQGTNLARTNPAMMCQLATFTYILLPNDHTQGAAPGAISPQSYIEDNDEATGWLVDAVSHSQFWPDTLIVVIEDDPGDTGDHVDNHRSVMLLASPWVRRGYTTHVHYDESSIHHTIELILGVPPHNEAVANAAPLYDLFTGTPDFTPYRYTPRTECETHNPMMGAFGQAASSMDFGQPDNAPGLGAMVWQMLHQGAPAPFRGVSIPDEDGDGR